MTEFLMQRFVKNYNNTSDADVQRRYRTLANAVMIIGSGFMFIIKLFVHIITGSDAALADAYLSISDISASAMRIMRRRRNRRRKKSEEDAPAKGETVITFLIAFIIVELSIGCIREAVGELLKASVVKIGIISLLIYLITIPIKMFLMSFYIETGRRIKSQTFIKAGKKGRNELLCGALVIVSLLVKNVLSINIDALMTILISLRVIYSAFRFMYEAIRPMLLEGDTGEIADVVKQFVLSSPKVIGVHDVAVKNYGRDRIVASLYADVSCKMDIRESRLMLDKLQEEATKATGVETIIHIQPIEEGDASSRTARSALSNVIDNIDSRVSFRNFHMLVGEDIYSLIFDVSVPFEYTDMDIRKIEDGIRLGMHEVDPAYNCIFTMERKR